MSSGMLTPPQVALAQLTPRPSPRRHRNLRAAPGRRHRHPLRRLRRPRLALPRRKKRRARHHLRLHPVLRPRPPRRHPLLHILCRPPLPGLALPLLVLYHVLRRPRLRNRRLHCAPAVRQEEPLQPHLLYPAILLRRHGPRLPRCRHLHDPLGADPPPRP